MGRIEVWGRLCWKSRYVRGNYNNLTLMNDRIYCLLNEYIAEHPVAPHSNPSPSQDPITTLR